MIDSNDARWTIKAYRSTCLSCFAQWFWDNHLICGIFWDFLTFKIDLSFLLSFCCIFVTGQPGISGRSRPSQSLLSCRALYQDYIGNCRALCLYGKCPNLSSFLDQSATRKCNVWLIQAKKCWKRSNLKKKYYEWFELEILEHNVSDIMMHE